MQDCNTIREGLTEYQRGGMDASAAAPIRLHLEECTSCQQELAQFQRLDGLLDRHLFDLKPSRTLVSSFANRLAAERMVADERATRRSPSGLFGWLLGPMLAPVAVAAALALFVLGNWKKVETPTEIATKVSHPAHEAKIAQGDKPTDSKPKVDLASQNPEHAPPESPEVYVDFDVIQNLDRIAPELIGGATS